MKNPLNRPPREQRAREVNLRLFPVACYLNKNTSGLNGYIPIALEDADRIFKCTNRMGVSRGRDLPLLASPSLSRAQHLIKGYTARTDAEKPHLQWRAVYLRVQQFIPEDRLQQTFSDLFQVNITTATLMRSYDLLQRLPFLLLTIRLNVIYE